MEIINGPLLTLRYRDGTDPPISDLVLHSRPTGTTVKGALLEAVVKADDLYLLFTTDDTPYEEILRIHLIDDVGNTIESLWIGNAYSTGNFRQLEIMGSDSVRFLFFGDTDWTVSIRPSPRFQIPLFADPPGVFRPFQFWSRLIVEGNPKPETRR